MVGTLDTIIVSLYWTGNAAKAFAIGGSEVLTKVGLYYLHERLWARIPLGTVRKHSPFSTDQTFSPATPSDSHMRSVVKAVSWRTVGTIDTIVVSMLWTGDSGKALAIGGTELVTKIILYYVHERAWARIPLGTLRRIFRSRTVVSKTE